MEMPGVPVDNIPTDWEYAPVAVQERVASCVVDKYRTSRDSLCFVSGEASPRSIRAASLAPSINELDDAADAQPDAQSTRVVVIDESTAAPSANNMAARQKFQRLAKMASQRHRVLRFMGGDGFSRQEIAKDRGCCLFDPFSVEEIECCTRVLHCLAHVVNLFVVPYRCMLHPEGGDPMSYVEWCVDVLQLLLVILAFFTPFNSASERIALFSLTSRHYAATDLAWDATTGLTLLPFGFLVSPAYAPLFRLNKVMLPTMLRHFNQLNQNPVFWKFLSPYGAHTLLQFLTMLVVLHVSSCTWYTVLKNGDQDELTYGALSVWRDDLFGNTSRVHLYLKGVEWSLKHMAGYGVLCTFPQTDEQVLYMLAVAAVGLCMYTNLLASVSSFVNHIAETSPIDKLRSKLDDVSACSQRLRLPTGFQFELRSYYMHVFKVSGQLGLNDILDDLPPSLLSRVNHEIGKSILDRMPMFHHVRDPSLVEQLVNVLVPKVFLPGLEIVSIGQRCQEMVFVWSGELREVDREGEVLRVLSPGDVFGEISLMATVKRLTAVITSVCTTIFVLTRESFQRIILQYPDFLKDVREFEKKLVCQHPTEVEDRRISLNDDCEQLSASSSAASMVSMEGPDVFLSRQSGGECSEFLQPGTESVGGFLYGKAGGSNSIGNLSSLSSAPSGRHGLATRFSGRMSRMSSIPSVSSRKSVAASEDAGGGLGGGGATGSARKMRPSRHNLRGTEPRGVMPRASKLVVKPPACSPRHRTSSVLAFDMSPRVSRPSFCIEPSAAHSLLDVPALPAEPPDRGRLGQWMTGRHSVLANEPSAGRPLPPPPRKRPPDNESDATSWDASSGSDPG